MASGASRPRAAALALQPVSVTPGRIRVRSRLINPDCADKREMRACDLITTSAECYYTTIHSATPHYMTRRPVQREGDDPGSPPTHAAMAQASRAPCDPSRDAPA
ncbi:hypothetical protein Cob_v002638 [Colletotrichum orbiculare MAFF 240422]|uniref:Uncharacterized protein n=1 Tax=Colletotrichum orbiculare (strain 104-T / ATCC 96160 / CBS 514.97 / LARS 414 / MAFF 240422) TaxID=1213857 RepID=A0A484G2J0_COLOR|nr:hypothetical protein Cob_v002638 [Colletotrichum orbiculare MAFF 240422]